MNKEEKVLLGHVSGLFGVKGWVKVFSYTRPRSQIVTYKRWYLGDSKDYLLILEEGRSHKEGVIAKLEGINDRDSAISLIDSKIWISEAELEPLENNEFYWYQLIGLEVYDSHQTHLGTVTNLMETGANDVLIVRSKDDAEHLIPYIKERVVKTIDLTNKRMIVDWDTEY